MRPSLWKRRSLPGPARLGVAGTMVLATATAAWPQAPPVSREYVYAGDRLLAVVAPPQIVIDDIAVVEGQSGTRAAIFTVSLTSSPLLSVTVAWATADGTAVAPGDYTSASGTLTFVPGQVTQPISVTVVGDPAPEGRETFFVNLTNAQGASIADAQGQATIVDDEAARFVPLDPCRVADTRTSSPMAAGTSRNFAVSGVCGVPANASAVALVVTTTSQSGVGNLRAYPAPGPLPLASVVNFAANHPRAGNMIVPLGQDGRVGVFCEMPSGSTQVIVDVMGYFQ